MENDTKLYSFQRDGGVGINAHGNAMAASSRGWPSVCVSEGMPSSEA